MNLMQLEAWEAVLVIVTVIGGMLAIRKYVLSILDGRIGEQVATILAPTIRDLDRLTTALENGIKGQVTANRDTLREQDVKLDDMARGLAEIKGAVRALSDAVLGRRPNGLPGRRHSDPDE
jgi:hypothetical protein